ncbi:MAG: GNAT family N-acetyltransferase [Cellvibrionaceae bacterium]
MIRPYTQKDYSGILTIYHQSKLDELRYEKNTFTLLPLNKDSRRLQQLLDSDIYVYEEEQQVIAYAALCDAEIRALFVEPNSRGKGVGRKLLTFLLERAPQSTTLNIAKSNIPAKKLYEQYNFKVIKEFKTDYNGITVSANTMKRNIP